MIVLDSELMDYTPEQEQRAGHSTKLKDVRLEDFVNDDHCSDMTRFTRAQILVILDFMELPETVRVAYDYTVNPPKYYKFHREALFIYMLRRMVDDCTHKQMASGFEFGGDDKRWATGYKWMVFTIEEKLGGLVSPQALKLWAPQFPFFAERIRQHLLSRKERKDHHGVVTVYQCTEEETGGPGEFNIFSFTDCTVYEISRPGSGPCRGYERTINNERRENWYVKQRAFYDGYHRGMEACVKVLTIYLPNGMTAAMSGPTSGRKEDKNMFKLGEFDNYMMQLCVDVHAGDLHCIYGDSIFAGYWHCLRTAHVSSPHVHVTQAQKNVNDNMFSAREFIEHSCGRAQVLFPLITSKPVSYTHLTLPTTNREV